MTPKEYNDIVAEYHAARQRMWEALMELCPVGSAIRWAGRDRILTGRVTWTDGQSLCARNDATGNVVSVKPDRVIF